MESEEATALENPCARQMPFGHWVEREFINWTNRHPIHIHGRGGREEKNLQKPNGFTDTVNIVLLVNWPYPAASR